MSATTAVEMPEIGATGLTPKEVVQRIESGQSNAVKTSSSRSVQDIVRANVFTLFNGIIFAAMVLVLITGSWKDAVFGFVILINTGIGIVTELKAKRTLDRLSILVTSDYAVRRDGENTEVPSRDIVLGDLLWIRSGEQVPADAQVLSSYGLELDESMLTGESRTVRKEDGDQVYSGSTAVSGVALARVNAVGEHSYAATLTAQAKVYKKTVSDLNKGINTILKFMTFLVVPLCVLLVWSQMRTVGGWNAAIASGEWRQAIVSAVAGVVGMIPEGLVLLTSLNFAVAAMRLARKNTLVQELESVETLARVDCLNLDKTGTITESTMQADDPLPLAENIAMPRREPVHKTETYDMVQAKLCMLFTLGEPMRTEQLAAVRLAMALYGGSVTSRLFLNVRERDHLCYYCSSSFQSFTGSMAVNSGVEHADAARAEQAILKELADLCDGPITDDEFEDCRRGLLSGMQGVEDTLGGIETWYYIEVLRGGDPAKVQTPAEARAALQAVTKDDVRAILRKLTLSVSYLLTKEVATHAAE